MIQGVDHIAIAVSDMNASLAFYVGILKMRPVDSRSLESSFYWLNFGAGQTLNLCFNPEATPKFKGEVLDWNKTAHLAFAAPEAFVDEVEAELEKIDAVYKRSGSSLYFTDPDTNFLELTYWREKRLQASGAKHW